MGNPSFDVADLEVRRRARIGRPARLVGVVAIRNIFAGVIDKSIIAATAAEDAGYACNITEASELGSGIVFHCVSRLWGALWTAGQTTPGATIKPRVGRGIGLIPDGECLKETHI